MTKRASFRRRLLLVLADMLVLAMLASLVFPQPATAGPEKCVTIDDIYRVTAQVEMENRVRTGRRQPFFIREIPSSQMENTVHIWVYYRGESKGYMATLTSGCLSAPITFIRAALFMGIMTPQERRVFLPHLLEGDPA